MRRLFCKSLASLIVSITLDAATIATATAIHSGAMCFDTGPSSAECSVTAEGRTASASAYSSFGAVSGSLMGRILHPDDYVGVAFQGSFSDYLVITGAAGNGSLTATFNVQLGGLGSYSVIAGDIELGDSLSASTVPVTSPFTFGARTRIGGMLMGSFSSVMLSPEDREFQFRADLRITEIRVFDAAGDLVAGALIEPQGSEVDFFRDQQPPLPIPEPPAWMLAAGGICVFVSCRLVRVMRRAA